MKINDYDFNRTCMACPEQYEVLDENGNMMAYIRLRWGYLYAVCPDIGGTVVYEADIGDDYTGCFANEIERMAHLHNIAINIKEFYEGDV